MRKSRMTIAIPPGETIKEQLADRGMSQKEFAARLGMSEKHISKLINGEVQLTSDMALRLEMVLGVPAGFWNNLESIYREKLAKVRVENEMDEDLEIVRKIPYNEMSKFHWVAQTRNLKERVFNLRKFFEVVRLEILTKSPILSVAYRKLGEGAKCDYALMSWVQKAKVEARGIQTDQISIAKIKHLLPEIRSMTMQDPSIFCDVLCKKLRECGIALVFLPHIGGSFLHGASFCDGSKIVVGMTVRGKDADKFWFSLLHEIGHIVLGHIVPAKEISDADEACADAFARDVLIPENKFKSFVDGGNFNQESIVRFAEIVGIHSGIVVGRLQKEGYIPYQACNELKIKYKLTA